MLYGTDIKQSDTIVGFWHIGGVKQVLLEWDATKIKGVSCFYEDGGLREIHSRIEFIEDGYVGKAIITFTADPYEGTTLREGTKKFYLQNEDDSYRQNISIDLMVHSVNETDFCSIDASTIFVPYHLHNTIINYTISGSASIQSIEAPEGSGIYATDNRDGTIQIMSLLLRPDIFGSRIRKSKVTITYTNGSVSYIGVWMVMPNVRPICEDIDATMVNSKEVVGYKVYSILGIGERKPIYAGKSYKKPGSQFITINVNKVCESFIFQDITPGGRDRYVEMFNYGRGFELETDDGTIIGNYILYNSWTYEEEKRLYGFSFAQNRPLTSEIVRGQTLLSGIWTCNYNPENNAELNNSYLKESATIDGEYTDVPGFESVFLEPWQYGVVNFNTKNVKPDTNFLLTWNYTYKLVDNCGIDYVIHYQDPRGGYSSYPIKANVNKRTSVTPHTINRSYNNTTSDFEVKTYMNEVEDEYEVTLPLLSKYEAGRIWELTQSPAIWLERLKDNKFIPVLIDDKKTDLKNNEKIRNYTLTFKTSQSKLRK